MPISTAGVARIWLIRQRGNFRGEGERFGMLPYIRGRCVESDSSESIEFSTYDPQIRPKWTGEANILKITGECCICGTFGELTFEHVPPRAAFNDRRVFEAKLDSLLGGQWKPGTPITKGRYVQRGVGRHSLCGKCNNDTGTGYGQAYVDFARQAMILLDRSKGKMSLGHLEQCPISVISALAERAVAALVPGCVPDRERL